MTSTKRIPAETGIWIMIFGDMMIFSLFFLVFLQYKGEAPEIFLQSQSTLNVWLGFVNMLLLLTSSWFVAMSLNLMKRGFYSSAKRFLLIALAFGIGFGVIKVIEYTQKFSAGINLTTNDFYMFYFMYTGIHFVHVLIGLGVLTFLIVKTNANRYNDKDRMTFESGACFWHMVDLLWIILFPLLYLAQ